MARPTARVLQLLELLQAGGTRTVGDLAARLGVDERTVRRYLEHLRELDVPVETVRGRHGGVRIGAGSHLPPLMLTDEEAIAALLGLLRAAEDGPSATLRTAAETAAAKIRRVLPSRLGERTAGLPQVRSTARAREPVGANADVLLSATTAVRERRPLLLRHRRGNGEVVDRTLLPHGVVEHDGRWYVTGLDSRADAVRTFRLDRLMEARIGPGRFRPPPDADPVQQVLASLAAYPRDFTVRVRVQATEQRIRRHLPAAVATLDAGDDGWTLVLLEAAHLDWVAGALAAIDAPFRIEQPEALRREVLALAARTRERAAAPPGDPYTRAVPNIFDVAKAAGVSHQTVSRVLNGDATVRPAVRERVDEAIQQLDYRPSAAARALARRKTRTVGILVVGMPFFGPASTANGFNAAARGSGWDVAIAATDGADAADVRAAAESLLAQDVRAVVVIAPGAAVGAALVDLAPRLPVVTSVDVVPGASTVPVDDVRGAEALAVEHLAALGHREVLHLSGPADWTEADQRAAGWRSASLRLGLGAPDPLRGDWSAATGHRLGGEIARAGAPTAVLCANDQMALGVLAAFREAGVRVPEDVSVVGFDDIPEAAFFPPALTTLRVDFPALGRSLMHRVDDLLAGRTPEEQAPLVPVLVARDSTAAPRRHPLPPVSPRR